MDTPVEIDGKRELKKKKKKKNVLSAHLNNDSYFNIVYRSFKVYITEIK